MFLTKRKKEE